jgi:hypothetical protein
MRGYTKNRCVESLKSSSDDDDDESDNEPSSPVKKKPRGARNRIHMKDRAVVLNSAQDQIDEPNDINEFELESKVPFCCAYCTHDLDEAGYWITPDETDQYLCHRRCCHGLLEKTDEALKEWVPPYLKSYNDSAESEENEKGEYEWKTQKELKDAHKILRAQESQLVNDDNLQHHVHLQYHHPSFVEKILQPFTLGNKRKKATVLDCFAGVGTGCIILKKLKIGIEKIIYIEHDKVAQHVFKQNHDPNYNPDLPDDGIKYHYISKMEEAFYDDDNSVSPEKIKKIEDEYGPFDIILGTYDSNILFSTYVVL